MSNIDENKALINTFYRAFRDKDASKMIDCYAKSVVFEDPAFGQLKGEEARKMWEMLVERGGKELTISHKILDVTNNTVTANWEAIYPFSQTLRMVHNKITAHFTIEDGKIVKHKDRFNLWKWSAMALGLPGMLLGWSPFLKNKIRKQALKALYKYMEK